MPVLTVKDSKTETSTEFFYLDSGAPECQLYTTLVIVHGLSFHSAGFKHVLSLAPSRGLRLVCLNRRDYLGSSLYSPSELKVVTEGNADEREAFLTARGVEIALFLNGLIDALELPPPTADGMEGGLGIMGWSLGNLFTLCAIAAAPSLQSAVHTRLRIYMRRLIVFDPPTLALGIPSSPKLYVPIFDEGIPHDERINAFACWVSSYFAHGDLSTRDLAKLEFGAPDPTRKSDMASLSPEELRSLLDPEPVWRSDNTLVMTSPESLLFTQTFNALFDSKTRSLWPKLGVWTLYCDSSPGLVIHAAFEIERLAKENMGQPVQFLAIEDAHHVVFWDEPEKALKAFDHCLRH